MIIRDAHRSTPLPPGNGLSGLAGVPLEFTVEQSLEAAVAGSGGSPEWRSRKNAESRKHLQQACEASLRRLGVDTIDLYQLHRLDSKTPIEETLEALNDLIRAGKIRYIGSSNFAAWQLVDAHWTARERGLAAFVSAQNRYSLLDRDLEREFVPAAVRHGIGVIPYSPLENGLLTGKYKRGTPPPEGTRLGNSVTLGDGMLTDANFDKLEVAERFARERNHSLVDLALGWLASQPHVSSVIAGATKPAQVEENVAAGEWRLSQTDLEELDAQIAAA